VRYAFEYARVYGRKKVTCFTKDNIMKQTDGLFHQVFDEVAKEYPHIEHEHWIVDIGAAKLADSPELFDVIVMPNLYGDILSDVAAQITGSVGLAGSANIGEHVAMFEAIHGSAPRIAGMNKANPSGLLLGAIQMLVHIGQHDVAERVQNAWLKTLEDGMHTYDIFEEGTSKQALGTQEFAQAVIDRLGERPTTLKPVDYSKSSGNFSIKVTPTVPAVTELVGVDVFLHHIDRNPDALAAKLQAVDALPLHLSVITNRGVKVWPEGFPETFCTDHWRCRFMTEGQKPTNYAEVLRLLQHVSAAGLDVIKTENLYLRDGKQMFTAAQGQ
jgi:isocitrate dehydrogenase